MRRSSVALALAMLLLGVAVGWLLRPPAAVQEEPAVELTAMGLRESKVVLRHRGVKQAEVRASRVDVSRDLRYVRFSSGVEIVLYHKDMVALRLYTRQITLDRQTNDMVVDGPLVATSSGGDRLRAAEARWIHANQRLIFSRRVHVQLRDSEFQASSLVVDTSLKTFDLAGEVEATFRLDWVLR